VSGSGVADVVAAGMLRPDDVHFVLMRASLGHVATCSRADASGSRLRVLLGPASPLQQRFSADWASPWTRVYTTAFRSRTSMSEG
jgi:hypothetical protein